MDGKLVAKEIIVTLDNWADHVFAENYPLLPLGELEAYIKANKHLPNIPSETAIAESGVNVGEMQITLLEKIEELTLYLIQLKKENEELKQRIELLEQREP